MTTDDHHGPPDHKHGISGTRYVSHRCRCDNCRAGNRDATRNLRRTKLYGRYRPPVTVKTEIVRQHIRALMDFGIGCDRVAHLAGVT